MTSDEPLAYQNCVRSLLSDGASETTGPARSESPRVLIVTQRFDPHADVVEQALQRRSVGSLRVNIEDLHSHRIAWGIEPSTFTLTDGEGDDVDMRNVRSCYFRRPVAEPNHPELDSREASVFAARETDAFLWSLYALRGIRWVSPPHLMEPASSKLSQLALASRLGFAVPRTVVTNDPAQARSFAGSLQDDVVVKPLRTAHLTLGETRLDFAAQRLSAAELMACADAVRLAPTVLQEHIPKKAEVRVTVIGDDVFAVQLSPRHDDLPVDWSRADPTAFSHEPVELCAETRARIAAFVDWYGMPFAALDFLRTVDDRLVFLENNPNGAWYWLERETGLPLSRSMVRLLMA